MVPRVNANGNVRLEIEQEISQVASTTPAGSLTPTVSERKVRSSVAVASGQTVLLAGLISEQQSGGRNGLPGWMTSPAPEILVLADPEGNDPDRTHHIHPSADHSRRPSTPTSSPRNCAAS